MSISKATHTVSIDVTLLSETGSGVVEVRTKGGSRLLGHVEVGPGFPRSTPVHSDASMVHRNLQDAADDIVLRTLVIAALDRDEEATYVLPS
jgi:hypothetical protein